MASFNINNPYKVSNDLSYGQAFKQAGEAIGYGKENVFSWKGKDYNLEQEAKLPPINPLANRSVGDNFDKSDTGKSTSYGQDNYDMTTLKKTALKKNVGQEIITREQANEVVNHPELTAQKFEQKQASAGDDSGNYRIDHSTGERTELPGIAPQYDLAGEGTQVQDVPIYAETSTNLAPGEVREGFLPDDLMASITGERFNAPEMDYRPRNPGYDSGGFPIGSGGDPIGPPPTGFDDEGLAGLFNKGKDLLGKGLTKGLEKVSPMLGKGGDLLGKAGDFMKGPGGQGVMAGINILGEMGAMSARKDAMKDIDLSMGKLETAMEQATMSRSAGYTAAEDAFQQGKGLVGKRLTDSMKGAFAGVRGSNIVTGSREKVKKNIRGQVSNQADMAVAGLETEMAKSKASVLQQSRGDRSKAKAAYADAKRQQDELKQQQKMGPLKMAANVVGVVNPAVGMAMNAGLSLYDAYG